MQRACVYDKLDIAQIDKTDELLRRNILVERNDHAAAGNRRDIRRHIIRMGIAGHSDKAAGDPEARHRGADIIHMRQHIVKGKMTLFFFYLIDISVLITVTLCLLDNAVIKIVEFINHMSGLTFFQDDTFFHIVQSC